MIDDTPDRACVRPCHDCPFRQDIPAYQSQDDVLNNVTSVLDPTKTCCCHQTDPAVGGKGPKLVCAGFILFLKKVGLERPRLAGLRLDESKLPIIFDSIAGFVLHAPCPDQSMDGRVEAWVRCQPRGREAALQRLEELGRRARRYHQRPRFVREKSDGDTDGAGDVLRELS